MEMLTQLIIGKIDILFLSETKLHDSFTSTQFLLPGFSPPYRRNRNIHGGGIMFSPPYRRDRNIHGGGIMFFTPILLLLLKFVERISST